MGMSEADSSRGRAMASGSRMISLSWRTTNTKKILSFAISVVAITGSRGRENRPPRAKNSATDRSVVHAKPRTRRRPHPRNTLTRSGNSSYRRRSAAFKKSIGECRITCRRKVERMTFRKGHRPSQLHQFSSQTGQKISAGSSTVASHNARARSWEPNNPRYLEICSARESAKRF